ncbi:hypothetical protein [Puia dinghuensis]|uniref:Uncharacterized protein n=1 Tax=Puia dinghuensis TaxID=1792502 RepID=A0A8J2UIH3_9BACT|nr:hypothetical protein [Puia dinghuensis]GGB22336.1 hypothetical protein GCM10011511_52780 [Puia dinghuensis]
MRPILPFFLLLLFVVQQACAQSGLNGVFAGVQVTIGASPGSMGRTDHVIWFRSDGTFNSDLHKPDWKTATTGHYTVSGNKVVLQYPKGGKDFYTLQGDMLTGGGYNLIKLPESNSVPPGMYHFNYAYSSGGAGTGLAYAGTASNTDLSFDGNGNFSRNAMSATQVGGGVVAGGSTRSNSGSGHYTIKDGVLVLTYADGHTQAHSFFSRPGEKPVMAAVDGNIYFLDDPSSAKSSTAGAHNSTSAAGTDAPTIKALLYKANQVQGGSRLDNLQRARVTGSINNITFINKIDLHQQRYRLELYKGSTLAALEQVEGATGWVTVNGNKTSMSPDRMREIKEGFCTGVLGLRREVISRMESLKQQHQPNNNTSVTFMLDGEEFVFMLNGNGQLIGDGVKSAGKTRTSVYGDLRNVDGLLLPFTESDQQDGQKVLIRYTRYELDPTFSEADWQ